jgi:ATP-dependent helicase YprA (DUF1998 family)
MNITEESVALAEKSEVKPIIRMLIKVKPYKHQIEAYNFALKLFGIRDSNTKQKGGDEI